MNLRRNKRMKSTGMVRKLDNLNRIVIPKELTKTYNLEDNAALEIFTEGENIILRKYSPGCTFCNGLDNLKDFEGYKICGDCRVKLKNVL